MCLMSVMTPMEFSRAEHSADHSALIRRNSRNLRYRIAVVDTRRVLRARETTAVPRLPDDRRMDIAPSLNVVTYYCF
jgi:hypothetical protein